MSDIQQELLSDLADILVEEGARSGVGDGSPVAEAVLSASVHLLQWDEPAVSFLANHESSILNLSLQPTDNLGSSTL